MPTPFLSGKTVYLRGLREEDLAGPWYDWFDDAEVCRFNNHHRFPNTARRMREFLEAAAGGPHTLVLAVCDAASHAHLGNVSLDRIDLVNRSAEFSVIIGDRAAWGKGVATEAGRLLLGHGFRELGLVRIGCGTGEDNTAMQKLALRLGMREEGRRRQALYKNGRFVDVLEFGVLRDEFLAADRA